MGAPVKRCQPDHRQLRACERTMSLVDSFLARMRALVGRQRFEQALDAELRFHLDHLIDENLMNGMSPEEARAAAQRSLGNATLVREQCRDTFGLTLLDDVRQDTRRALRALWHRPGFAIAGVLTLGLGLGASTAVFSLVDAVRTGAIPYRDPDELVKIFGTTSDPRVERRGASYPDYQDWRALVTSFSEMAAFDPQKLTLTGGDQPERVNTEYVSASYFSVLDVTPAQGRTFQPDEDLVSRDAAVVIMSDSLWKRRFGSDPGILGRTIAVTGRPFPTYTVVGVMPPSFRGVTDDAELWMPFAQWAPARIMTDRGQRWLTAVARLRPNVSAAVAQQELNGISQRLEGAHPATNRHRGAEVSALHLEVLGLLRSPLRTLMIAVGLVLLMACANVANLLVVRLEARRRESAVCRALGAGQARLVRQLLTENTTLALLGSLAGLALAQFALMALLPLSPVSLPSFVTPALSLRVLTFSMVASLVCGLLITLPTALQLRVSDLNGALKESTRTGRGLSSRRLRHAVIVAELSIAVVLLVGAGLLIQSVRNTARINLGFEAGPVLTLHASIPHASVPGSGQASRAAVEGRVILDHIRSVPGVVMAALGNDSPLDGNAVATFYAVEPQARDIQIPPRGYLHRVSPAFFSALQIPIISGRTFSDADMEPTAAVVIVSERLAQEFGGAQSAIGRRVRLEPQRSDSPWLTIVGVAGNVRFRRLLDTPVSDPDIYVPFLDRNSQVAIVVRTGASPASLTKAVTDAIRSANTSTVVYDVAPMAERVAAQSASSRFVMWLMSVFGATALSLAAVGLYGVMSHLVILRTREIGIRTALGAKRVSVVWLILSQNVSLIGLGLLGGFVGAVAFGVYLQGVLVAVPAYDALVLAVALFALGAVGLAASYFPARRAATIDPLTALRQE